MRKRRPQRHTSPMTATQKPGAAIEAFSFGEPVPVLSQREVFDYLEAMQLKRNILRSCFIPRPLALHPGRQQGRGEADPGGRGSSQG